MSPQIQEGSQREASLQSQLQSVSASLAESKEEAQRTAQHISELKARIGELEKRLTDEQEAFKSASYDLLQMKTVADKREEEVAFLQGEVAQASAALESLQKQASDLKGELAAKDDALQRERSVSAAAKSQVGRLGHFARSPRREEHGHFV